MPKFFGKDSVITFSNLPNFFFILTFKYFLFCILEKDMKQKPLNGETNSQLKLNFLTILVHTLTIIMIIGMIIIVFVIIKEFFYKPEENYYELVLPKSIKIPDKSKLDTIDFDTFGRFNPFLNIRNEFKEGNLEGFWATFGNFVDSNWLNFFRTFQMSMLIFILFFLILSIIIANTRYGRYIYAIGSNALGARQSGINTSLYTMMTYMLCSLSAAFGALLFLGRAPYAKSDYGQMWELDAIAAVVIGGTSLFGGRGSLWGTFMGVILLKLINNGLTLAQLDTFWQMVVTGLIILLAVGIDLVRQSKNSKNVRKLLVAVSSFMAFLTMMTPASLFLKAQISLLEHNASKNLQIAGEKLANGQTARLLGPKEIDDLQQIILSNTSISFLCLILFILSLLPIFFLNKLLAIFTSICFILLIIPIVNIGYAVTIPFLIFGVIVLIMSLFVDLIFERARKLDSFIS